jgi:two-component sensor histidine kinase
MAAVGIGLDSQAGYTLQSQEPVIVRDLRTETRFTGPALLHDHGVRSGMSVVIAGSDQRPFGVFGLHAKDVRTFDGADMDFLTTMANIVANAARHFRHQESQNLLLREMAHRSGNLLQIVASIAGQTFSSGCNPAEAVHRFGDQLASLSRANHLVAQDGWTTTRFSELARETLMPFGERIRFTGRDILLPADLSFDLSLVLHELATNATKYGSFASKGSGQVRVSWNVDRLTDHEVFHFEWHDPLDGPVMPVGPGFGTRLLTAIIEKKWQGTAATASFAPSSASSGTRRTGATNAWCSPAIIGPCTMRPTPSGCGAFASRSVR